MLVLLLLLVLLIILLLVLLLLILLFLLFLLVFLLLLLDLLHLLLINLLVNSLENGVHLLLEGRLEVLQAGMEVTRASHLRYTLDTLLSHVTDTLVPVQHTVDQWHRHALQVGLQHLGMLGGQEFEEFQSENRVRGGQGLDSQLDNLFVA